MLETALSLIDRLIQLATAKERNKERFFNNFIGPLYNDAEQIARDYMILFAELIHRLAKDEEAASIVEWLEERRTKFQPIRMKVRALLEEGLNYGEKASLDKFRRGVWGLMKGGISLMEDGHGAAREYGFGDHTVLDMIHRMHGDLSDEKVRVRLIDQARRQQMAVERAWRDVVIGYSEIRHRTLKSR